MKYWVIDARSYGELGPRTVFSPTGELVAMQYVLQHPLEDHFVRCAIVGNYLVSLELLSMLGQFEVGGYAVFDCEVVKDSQFYISYSKQYEIPALKWLKVTGKPFEDDFGVHKRYLIVSDTVRQVIEELPHKLVEIIEPQTIDFDMSVEERKKRIFEEAKRRRDLDYGPPK